MSLSLRALRILCLLIAGSIWLGLTATAVVPPTSLELVQQFDQYLAYEYTKALSTQFDGRRVGTPGGEAAAQFVASAFQQMGLQPAGDNGTYFQNFDMPFLELAETPQFVLFDERGTILRNFQHRVDFREFIVETSGPGQANAEVVYVGSGSPDEFASIGAVAQKIALAIPRPGSDPNSAAHSSHDEYSS